MDWASWMWGLGLERFRRLVWKNNGKSEIVTVLYKGLRVFTKDLRLAGIGAPVQ